MKILNKENKAEQPQRAKKENKSLTKTNKMDTEKDGKIKKFFKKFIEILKSKWLVKASTTLLLVLIIFAIYIGVTKLLENVNIPDVDCTTNKIYSLSDETKSRLKDIDKDIEITLINYGSSDSMKNIMDQYKALNKKIKVEEIDDITSRIDIQQKYSIDSTASLIVISCGGEEITLDSYDLYSYDYSTYQQVDLTEEAVTNAIVNITAESKPQIYFMDNHAKYPSTTNYADLIKVLEGDANKVSSINLLTTGRVPEDCDTLVITTLKEDITEPEKDYIVDYINAGGNLLLLCGTNFLEELNLSNFQEILNLYRLNIKDGIVLEGNANKMLSGYPDMIIENVAAGSITRNKDLNLNALLVDAGAIEVRDDEENSEIEYETIVETSDTAFLRTNLNIASASRTDLDSEEDSYILGILATKTINDEKSSKLIMFADEMFTQVQLQNYIMEAGNNQDVIANSVAYLNKKENTITIRKNYDTVTYTVTEAQNKIIMRIIFIMPFAIIIVGIVVWQVRRKRK